MVERFYYIFVRRNTSVIHETKKTSCVGLIAEDFPRHTYFLNFLFRKEMGSLCFLKGDFISCHHLAYDHQVSEKVINAPERGKNESKELSFSVNIHLSGHQVFMTFLGVKEHFLCQF